MSHSPEAIAAYPDNDYPKWASEPLRTAFDAGRASKTPAATREAIQVELDRHEYDGDNQCICGEPWDSGASSDGVFWSFQENRHRAESVLALLVPGGPIQQVEAPDTNGEQA